MKITGACHCTAVQLEAEVDPATTSVCHCTDCQILTATAFRVSVHTVPGTLRFTATPPKIYTKTAESGRKREQAFCGDCGSPIYSTSPGPEPKVYNLRTGVIHQRDQLAPVRQSWTRSKLAWLDGIAALPGVPTSDAAR
jgi:hypothetical protein